MARPASRHPTDGELEILHILWTEGPASLGTVCVALRQQRDVATTTVATMLRIMREKGLVRRKGTGRGATWTAVITHKKTARGLVGKLVDGLFDGSADRLVAHLIDGGQLSEEEWARLRRLIQSKASKGK